MVSERSEESEKICLSEASLFFRNGMKRSKPVEQSDIPHLRDLQADLYVF
jgi:hypothetical protein